MELAPHPKPKFHSLMIQYALTIADLAKASNRDPLMIWNFIWGNPVSRDDATQVLGAFQELRNVQPAINDVHILLEDEQLLSHYD